MKMRTLLTSALVLLSILCLVKLLKSYVQDNTQENIDFFLLKYEAEIRDILKESPMKCEQNLSMLHITGFSTLPHRIQDFLFYRHCRHFPMLLNVLDKCGGPQNSADVFLLLVIKSSPSNYEQREILRKTWARERLQGGKCIRTVFISGTQGEGFEKLRLNKLLKLENRKHGDILQWDFKDSFYNLTLKQILFLEWMKQWCPNAHFLFNGDDDIFANTDNMVEYLKAPDGNDGTKHLYAGYVMQHERPSRYPSSKYYVPVQVLELGLFPPYCSGGGFLLSRFTARTIYNMSYLVTMQPIDDAYIGMCLHKAGLAPNSHIGVRTLGLHIPSQKLDQYDPCYYREIILVHRFLPHEIYLMWQEIHQQDLKCGNTPSLPLETNKTKKHENVKSTIKRFAFNWRPLGNKI